MSTYVLKEVFEDGSTWESDPIDGDERRAAQDVISAMGNLPKGGHALGSDVERNDRKQANEGAMIKLNDAGLKPFQADLAVKLWVGGASFLVARDGGVAACNNAWTEADAERRASELGAVAVDLRGEPLSDSQRGEHIPTARGLSMSKSVDVAPPGCFRCEACGTVVNNEEGADDDRPGDCSACRAKHTEGEGRPNAKL